MTRTGASDGRTVSRRRRHARVRRLVGDGGRQRNRLEPLRSHGVHGHGCERMSNRYGAARRIVKCAAGRARRVGARRVLA